VNSNQREGNKTKVRKNVYQQTNWDKYTKALEEGGGALEDRKPGREGHDQLIVAKM